MNELIKTHSAFSFRRTLLTTASATAVTCIALVSESSASNNQDQPTVWIEIGGQLDWTTGSAQPYEPPFSVLGAEHGLLPVGNLQAQPNYSIGEQGSVSFQPRDSEWSFSISVQYGRANKQSYRHQQIPYSVELADGQVQHLNGPNPEGYLSQTSDYTVKSHDSHAVADFKVGRDVGLGLWKNSLPGDVALGIRFAQFVTRTKMDLHADPNPHLSNYGSLFGFHKYLNETYQFDKAKPEVARSFTGLGPTMSWNESLTVIGADEADSALTLDFSANAAVLFGRQKALIIHQTTGDTYEVHAQAFVTGGPVYTHARYVNSSKIMRSRSAIVPNVGGMAGISLRIPNGKLSLGYRADFFFGAMDGGIEARTPYDRNFYGPFATVGIGL